jgi:hypothetical protein
MSRPTPPASDERQARAFARAVERVGSSRFVDELLRFAKATLHIAGVDARRDAVHTLYVNGMGGTLSWILREDAPVDEILRYARARMRSMLWNDHRRDANTIHDPAAEERPDESVDVLTKLIGLRTLRDLERSFEGDEEVSKYLRLVLEGGTLEKIVAELDWTERQGDAVYKRFTRGVAAFRAGMNDEREAEPKAPALAGRSHA